MGLKEVYQAYKSNSLLYESVCGACLAAAGDIRNEDAGTSNHTNRLTWAGEVELDVDAKGKQMMARVLENATIAASLDNSTDNDVQFVVNGLIDTYAGV